MIHLYILIILIYPLAQQDTVWRKMIKIMNSLFWQVKHGKSCSSNFWMETLLDRCSLSNNAGLDSPYFPCQDRYHILHLVFFWNVRQWRGTPPNIYILLIGKKVWSLCDSVHLILILLDPIGWKSKKKVTLILRPNDPIGFVFFKFLSKRNLKIG